MTCHDAGSAATGGEDKSLQSSATVPAAIVPKRTVGSLPLEPPKVVVVRSAETRQHQVADEKSVAMVTVRMPVPVSVIDVTLYDVDSVGVPPTP
jgi:hypothetical protein